MLLKPTAAIAARRRQAARGRLARVPDDRALDRARGCRSSRRTSRALARIAVGPERRVLARRRTQQLRVVAHYADGSTTDVTRLAQYQSNAPDLADGRRARAGPGARRRGRGGDHGPVRRPGRGRPRARSRSARSRPPGSRPASDNLIDPLRLRQAPRARPGSRRARLHRRRVRPPLGARHLRRPARRPTRWPRSRRDADPDKRARWVDRLLERPEYADLFAMKWSAILRNKRSFGPLSQPRHVRLPRLDPPGARREQALRPVRRRDPGRPGRRRGQPAGRLVPPGQDASRSRSTTPPSSSSACGIQCARCHHHPFERWSQDDYYGFAAFFGRVGRKPGLDPITPQHLRPARGPGRGPGRRSGAYRPRLLDGAELPDLGPRDDPRQALADWLRRPDNPFFARALVNRYWKHFFGRGLVEPEDDLRVSNPPTNPELLDALAADFVAHGLRPQAPGPDDRHQPGLRPVEPARPPERATTGRTSPGSPRAGCPAEVLLDAIGTVTGAPEAFDGLPRSLRGDPAPRRRVRVRLPRRLRPPQARERLRVRAVGRGQPLAEPAPAQLGRDPAQARGRRRPDRRLAADPRPDAAKVDELYRVGYWREPTDEEGAVCLAHLARCRGRGRLRQGYEDLVWTLINTKEFLFNH